ncbi:hypothetical protein EYF80_030701 [Liparis tanakae]|uniref:Uncharacterized protein n=1 Tax=Liparis tanakae TaxID=230148 RepID=A0A4Z2GZL5_9TELE|nr:hypothetical protein EYF80_030701 [Liparis tanakae]
MSSLAKASVSMVHFLSTALECKPSSESCVNVATTTMTLDEASSDALYLSKPAKQAENEAWGWSSGSGCESSASMWGKKEDRGQSGEVYWANTCSCCGCRRASLQTLWHNADTLWHVLDLMWLKWLFSIMSFSLSLVDFTLQVVYAVQFPLATALSREAILAAPPHVVDELQLFLREDLLLQQLLEDSLSPSVSVSESPSSPELSDDPPDRDAPPSPSDSAAPVQKNWLRSGSWYAGQLELAERRLLDFSRSNDALGTRPPLPVSEELPASGSWKSSREKPVSPHGGSASLPTAPVSRLSRRPESIPSGDGNPDDADLSPGFALRPDDTPSVAPTFPRVVRPTCALPGGNGGRITRRFDVILAVHASEVTVLLDDRYGVVRTFLRQTRFFTASQLELAVLGTLREKFRGVLTFYFAVRRVVTGVFLGTGAGLSLLEKNLGRRKSKQASSRSRKPRTEAERDHRSVLRERRDPVREVVAAGREHAAVGSEAVTLRHHGDVTRGVPPPPLLVQAAQHMGGMHRGLKRGREKKAAGVKLANQETEFQTERITS